MRQISKHSALQRHATILVSSFTCLLLGAACSAGQPIELPAKVKGAQQGENLESRGSVNPLKPPPTQPTSKVSSETQELIGQALLALSSLPTEQVAQLKTDNLENLSTKAKCGFVALQNEAEVLLKSPEFILDSQVIRFSSSNEAVTFADCRCLVSESAKSLGINLLPLSLF